ncbi:MAG: hypothetical protein C5B51_03125 [Terriglobia bacterium]|nr:MAG: hypothetical protein C5B51_03125 [Terriglobia bacterium]
MSGADSSIRIGVPAVLTAASASGFVHAMHAAAGSAAPVVVLEGGGGVFCRGLDVASAVTSANLEVFVEALLAVRQVEKVVIAVVDGVALGGGVGLAAAADLVIASQEASFGLPESLLGLAPAAILPFLLERMRPQQCRLWALAPHARPATDAARAGLVDVLTTRAGLRSRTDYWVRQFARIQATAIPHLKRLTSAPGRALESSLRDGIALTAELLEDPAVAERFREYG